MTSSDNIAGRSGAMARRSSEAASGSMEIRLPAGGDPTLADLGSNALPTGTRLGEFELTGVLGEGGFGIVYLAQDTALDRTVAIKEYMPASIAARAESARVLVRSEHHAQTFAAGLRSFVNEAKLLAQFDHPALVKVFRFWEANGTAYMVMPFYRGVTVKRALREMSAPPDEAWILKLVLPLLDALELIHGAHCYHRDIAPDNILILPDGKPLLLDFGAARRVIGDMTQALTVILKPGFAPIEQYAEAPGMRQGAWTDLYALAAVAYFAMVGEIPPPSVARMMSDTLQPLTAAVGSRYRQGILAAFDAALRVKPEERTQSVAALRQALLEGSDLGSTPAERGRSRPALSATQPLSEASTRLVAPSEQSSDAPSARPAEDQAATVILPHAGKGAATSSIFSGAQPGVWPGSGSSRMHRLSAPRFRALAVIGLAAAGLAGILAWWALQPSPALPAAAPAARLENPAPMSASPLTTASPPPQAVAAPSSVAPPPVGDLAKPSAPLTPVGALDAMAAASDQAWRVSASPDRIRVRIGRDRLRFTISSPRSGYVYIFMVGTDGRHIYQIFPNSLDKENTLLAGQPMQLPRAGWSMQAAGPAGTDRILVLVSTARRDFTGAGLRVRSPFPEFDVPVLQGQYAKGGATALIGEAQCDSAARACDGFGSAQFRIEEIGSVDSLPRTQTG